MLKDLKYWQNRRNLIIDFISNGDDQEAEILRRGLDLCSAEITYILHNNVTHGVVDEVINSLTNKNKKNKGKKKNGKV